jgi:glycosyltransferase involved in cell wall biosynthesis
MNQNFSIVVPCYNEQDAIAHTIEAIRNALPDKDSYELLFVNDGSTDETGLMLETEVKKDGNIQIVTHKKKRGYGAALKTGIRHAQADLIVITDADGTYPSERIVDLLEAIKDADMVIGSRTGESVLYPLHRRFPKAFLCRYANWVTGTNIPDLNSGLRVFRKEQVKRFMRFLPDTFSFTTTITIAFLTNNLTVKYIPINYNDRIGKSKISPIRDTLRLIQLLVRTGMYFSPIKVFSPVVGFIALSFLISLFYDIFWIKNLTDKTVMLLLFTLNSGMFTLLADMIDKRSGR